MSNINDVAREAGVSAMTVSRYFNQPDKLAPATRERVKEVIEMLNYVPNAAARSLVRGKTHTVAAVLSDITNPFFTTLARGIEDVAQKHGYTLFIGNTDESLEKEQQYLETLLSRRVDGLLLSPSTGDDHRFQQFEERDVPIVLIDREIESAKADVVRGDSRAGGYELTAHLIDQGYTDIAFIGGEPGLSSLRERVAGYQDAMEEAGLAPRIHLGHYSRQSGKEIVTRLIDEEAMPEAFVAANNLVAIGALPVLRERGVHVPNDVALACFEDVEIAAAIDPFLTVVLQPAYEMGRAAMQMLLRRVEGFKGPQQEEVFPTDLVVRRSSRRPGND